MKNTRHKQIVLCALILVCILTGFAVESTVNRAIFAFDAIVFAYILIFDRPLL